MDATDAVVVVYARAPRAGEVKTRLAAETGPTAALAIYRRLVQHVIGQARNVAGAATEVHVTPPDAHDEMAKWLGADLTYRPQVSGELGHRMRASFEGAFASGYRRVVIVGSDVPALRSELMEEALNALRAHRVVLGPANDGGYYLIGMSELVPEAFENIDWGTERVLSQTASRLTKLGITPRMLEPLTDVDRAADLPADWWAKLAADPARIG